MDNCIDLRIAHWSGSVWENNHDATTSIFGTCTGSGSGRISTTDNITSFSPFTFGSKSAVVNPMPIELLHFDANLIGNEVYVDWSTATETNNDFFTVEKSKDGANFEKVARVNGSSNTTSVQGYSTVDKNPYWGVSYYRLKQTDFDGEYKYSALVAVDYESPITIFPNPLEGNTFYIGMNGTEGQEVLVMLYNPLGTPVYSKTIIQQEGRMVAAIDLSIRPTPGIYFVMY